MHYWLQQKDLRKQLASDSLHISAQSQFIVTLLYTAANIAIYVTKLRAQESSKAHADSSSVSSPAQRISAEANTQMVLFPLDGSRYGYRHRKGTYKRNVAPLSINQGIHPDEAGRQTE
jgi:hypothetical protein